MPRLELTAACVAVRLSSVIQKELQYDIDDVYYWTDSMAVIRYLANETSRFKTFVANRITTIRDASEPHQWKYVPSELNPSDAASRGVQMSTLLSMTRWFRGPEFLWEDKDKWPKACPPPEDENDPEKKKAVNVTLINDSHDTMDKLFKYSSSWMKLKRTVAWYLVFMRVLKQKVEAKKDNCRKVPKKSPESHVFALTVDMMEKAEKSIILYVQKQYFPDILKYLQGSTHHACSKQILKLDPVLVDDVIRVGGRLDRAHLPFETKHPVLLPKDSCISRLLVYDSHEAVGHMGRASMMTHLRRKYWILGLGYLIKSITSRCVVCRKHVVRTREQKMADVPTDRLVPDEPPFTRVGVDFFGPINVKRGRVNVKRYGVIFTCMAMRAIHLEVARSLDTSSCINAFRRFFARRGYPKKIRSDNGTNLVGCEREMREEIKLWNKHQIQELFLQRNIAWEFNPPTGSHHGGIWERMIRTVRKVLYALMSQQMLRLDDEALQTLFCEVEAIVNSRPISHPSSDVNDFTPLTPNHLLFLKPGESVPPGVFNKNDCYAKRRWKQVQYLADEFWRRWSKEYLHQLQQRQKWLYSKQNVSVDDVVILVDNAPRNSWSLGRVIEVFKDRKGLVRIVKVKTAVGVLQRPVTKICSLVERENGASTS